LPRRERIYPLLREGEPPVVDVHPDGVPRGIRTRQDLLSQESPFDETYGVTGKTDGNRRNPWLVNQAGFTFPIKGTFPAVKTGSTYTKISAGFTYVASFLCVLQHTQSFLN